MKPLRLSAVICLALAVQTTPDTVVSKSMEV